MVSENSIANSTGCTFNAIVFLLLARGENYTRNSEVVRQVEIKNTYSPTLSESYCQWASAGPRLKRLRRTGGAGGIVSPNASLMRDEPGTRELTYLNMGKLDIEYGTAVIVEVLLSNSEYKIAVYWLCFCTVRRLVHY